MFNQLGRQYEVLVYERSRRKHVDALRELQGIDRPAGEDNNERLDKKIELVERILNDLTTLKDLTT